MLELAGIIILGIVAQWFAWRFKIPAKKYLNSLILLKFIWAGVVKLIWIQWYLYFFCIRL